MRKLGLKLAIAILASLVIGCKTPLLLDKSAPLTVPGKGTVFCTFSHEISSDTKEERINSMTMATLEIKDAGRNKYFLSTLTTGGAGWEVPGITHTENGMVTLISALSLEPGDYELVSRNVVLNFGVVTYNASIPLSKPYKFTVKPDEVVYIGSHRIRMTFGKSLLRQTLPSSCSFKMFDRFEEDKELLASIRPESKASAIRNALVDSAAPAAGSDPVVSLADLRPDSGLVIVSITDNLASSRSAWNGSAPTLTFLYKEPSGIMKDEITFQGHPATGGKGTLCDKDNLVIGQIVTRALKPGEYALSGVRLGAVKSVTVPNLQFRVKAGQVSYIGNIDYFALGLDPARPGSTDSVEFGRYRLQVTDQSARDLEQVRTLCPDIPLDQVAKDLASLTM